MYLVFGAWCALDPFWTAEAVGFSLLNNHGITEFIAVYGGLEFGVGVFFLISAFQKNLQPAGVIFGACFYLGIFFFRTIAISNVGFDIGNAINFYISEFILTLWSLYELNKLKASLVD
jgi:hypothetical protein